MKKNTLIIIAAIYSRIAFNLFLLGVICSLTIINCASIKNRANDFTDIMTISVGTGIGAEVRTGPLSIGLGQNSPSQAFIGPAIGSFPYSTVTYGAGWKRGTCCHQEGYDLTYQDASNKKIGLQVVYDELQRRNKFYDYHDQNDPNYFPAHLYTRIGVVAGLIISFQAEVNLGEFLDFFSGFIGLDLYDDDANQ